MKPITKDIQTIDNYIKSFPKEVQNILIKFRQVISKAAPDATEAFSYQMPTYKLNGKNLVHFAAFKNHVGFYPVPSGIDVFRKELASYIKGEGTIQFPIDKPIPYDLVKQIVEFRVKETLAKYPMNK